MKKFLFGLLVALASVSSQAAYLYWQVDSADYSGISGVTGYDLYGTDGTTATRIDFANAPMKSGSYVDVSDIKDTSIYYFYIELVNSENQKVGTGDTISYTSLAEAGSIKTSLVDVAQAAAWHGGTYSVPEPTSGLLMLMGVALVALKRRKV